jgi:hypothetical protein
MKALYIHKTLNEGWNDGGEVTNYHLTISHSRLSFGTRNTKLASNPPPATTQRLLIVSSCPVATVAVRY